MRVVQPYESLKHTLQSLKVQVEDSLPYIADYIPSDIQTPSELFYYLKRITTYKKDPKGRELLQCVRTLMENNRYGKSGEGDCDCFTILVLTACEYLGFKPQQVVLVGRSKKVPTHIYSLVYDKSKNKMCAMDLTNPYYCMERSYPYKQTLDFMILELADDFSLSGKTARKAKRAAKQQLKVAKKTARQEGKLRKVQARVNKRAARTENKAARQTSRQARRTDRVTKKEERKGLKRQVKVAKKEKRLSKVEGRQKINEARQAETLNRIQQRQYDNANDSEYSPDSDQSYIPDEDMIPGSSYEADQSYNDPVYNEQEEYDEYEQLPDEEYYPEEEYYEEEELEEGLSFFPGAMALINKVGKKVKSKIAQAQNSKVGKAAQKGTSKYNEIVSLKADNSKLKAELEQETKNKYIYSGVSAIVGTGIGVLIGRATK